MNIIKALEGLSGSNGTENRQTGDVEATARENQITPKIAPDINVMSSVLERHERISNRVKNKK